MSAQGTEIGIDTGAALPKVRADYLPLLLPLLLAVAAYPFIPSTSTWVTLTIAGLAMGMMIFVMASGLTLIFGLMDVLNFGHGAFIAIGAYVATLVLLPLAPYVQADSLLTNLAVLAPAAALAMAVSGALGLVVEQNFVFARQLGDTVAVMDDGKVAHTGGMAAFAADSGLQRHLLGLGMGEHQ